MCLCVELEFIRSVNPKKINSNQLPYSSAINQFHKFAYSHKVTPSNLSKKHLAPKQFIPKHLAPKQMTPKHLVPKQFTQKAFGS